MDTITQAPASGRWRSPLRLAACGGGGRRHRATGGAIAVTVTTTGTNLDPDGYALALTSVPVPVGINATVTIPDLDAGTWIVPLFGMAPNCAGDRLESVVRRWSKMGRPRRPSSTWSAAPALPALAGRIAFQSSRAGDSDIWTGERRRYATWSA